MKIIDGIEMNEEMQLFGSIFRIQRCFFERVRIELGNDGVHPRQGPIMMILMHHDGISQADLVRTMKVSAATIAVSISRLEKLGFVKRTRNAQNQRTNVLSLTEKGQEEARRLGGTFRAVQESVLKDFDQKDITLMVSLCKRMIDNLHCDHQPEEDNQDICTKYSNI